MRSFAAKAQKPTEHAQIWVPIGEFVYCKSALRTKALVYHQKDDCWTMFLHNEKNAGNFSKFTADGVLLEITLKCWSLQQNMGDLATMIQQSPTYYYAICGWCSSPGNILSLLTFRIPSIKFHWTRPLWNGVLLLPLSIDSECIYILHRGCQAHLKLLRSLCYVHVILFSMLR